MERRCIHCGLPVAEGHRQFCDQCLGPKLVMKQRALGGLKEFVSVTEIVLRQIASAMRDPSKVTDLRHEPLRIAQMRAKRILKKEQRLSVPPNHYCYRSQLAEEEGDE